MTTQQQPNIVATLPELMVYQELLRRGLRDGEDFEFQTALMGGRLVRGGAVVDFFFSNPPDLAFSVAGEYWHYGQGRETVLHDQAIREELATQGITLVTLDEEDVMRDVRYIVGEGLQYRDHSKLGGR